MCIEWTTLAQADLLHIHDYISRDNPKAAVAVIAAIRTIVRTQLATAPFSGRAGRVAGTRELVIPRLPYLIAYRVTDASVQVLRILHGAQPWPDTL